MYKDLLHQISPKFDIYDIMYTKKPRPHTYSTEWYDY
jgi:hypothetical protein